MIRNSVDHGIEPKEVRQAAGKRETGQLALRAYHQGGNIVIEIEDDGGGLNRDAILKKAVSQGLLTAADAPSDDEIFKLIFAPGFSTASQVTELSGRGIGMDVVRAEVGTLGGSIETTSTAGQGTSFHIHIPSLDQAEATE